MHLIGPLVSGVKGADNGHAELYRRGTGTRATYYADFEGKNSVSTGVDISLDSNGGAEVYVDELVNVKTVSSAGVVIREFVAGDSAGGVEVISSAFTGTDYDNGSGITASGLSKPTTLKAITDLWSTKAGSPDWDVKIDSVATNIKTALGYGAGILYNVTSSPYLALGDGLNDDTSAIQAAIDAASTAGGGIVWIPFGTYRLTTTLTLKNGVSIIGAGPKSAKFSIETAGTALVIADDLGVYRPNSVEGISFTPSASNTNYLVTVSSSFITFRQCEFGHITRSNGALIGRNASFGPPGTVAFYDCEFASNTQFFDMITNGGGLDYRTVIYSCTFHSNTAVTLISVPSVIMTGCEFINTLITSSGGIAVGGLVFGSYISGCVFGDQGGGAFTSISVGANAGVVFETQNQFGSSVTRYALNASSVVSLKSREAFVEEVFNLGSSSRTVNTIEYGTAKLEKTSGVTLAVTMAAAIENQKYTLVVWANFGSNVTVTFTGQVLVDTSATFVVTANELMVFEFIGAKTTGDAAWFQSNTPVSVPEL